MKNPYLPFIFLAIFYVTSFQTNAQKTTENNLFMEEKISIETGIGLQNGLLGFRTKYFFSDHFGTSFGIGTVGTGWVWNFALEARTRQLYFNKISPFVNVLFGVNAGADLYVPGLERKWKLFTGFSGSAGLKINLIAKWKTYLTLGVNYRIISDKVEAYYFDFNQEHGTNYNPSYSRFFPTVGITFQLKS